MKTLIKKATEKGFKPHILFMLSSTDTAAPETYHLWLCELQKWLFDNHKIWIEILPIAEDLKKGIYWNLRIWDLRGVGRTLNQTIKSTGDPYKLLKKGLLEALKLIK